MDDNWQKEELILYSQKMRKSIAGIYSIAVCVGM